jgi:cytochrome c oxidase accessory protein FixG
MAAKKPSSPNLDSLSMLDEGGHRRYVLPADVKGRFSRAKPWAYALLIALYIGLPFVTVAGKPAVLLDIPARQAWLFGQSFNAQDFYLVFFILTGIGFSLIVLSALFGRVWCGWACPQTVFLDGVYRRIERLIEGPAPRRARLADAPYGFDKIWRKGLKHAIYIVLSVGIAMVFVSYFLSVDGVMRLFTEGPADYPAAFIWVVVMSGILYFNFWWFREQLCIVICPYGRLQSALQDNHTLIIGYDTARGEPRGKVNTPGAGDCIDCGAASPCAPRPSTSATGFSSSASAAPTASTPVTRSWTRSAAPRASSATTRRRGSQASSAGSGARGCSRTCSRDCSA